MSAKQVLSVMQQERNLWRKLAEARGRLLVAYRLGKLPGRAIDDITDAKAALEKLGITVR